MMRLRKRTLGRWAAVAGTTALLLVGLPGAAGATDGECAEHGNLLGLSLDDCGLRVTLLGIEVQVGGEDETEEPPADDLAGLPGDATEPDQGDGESQQPGISGPDRESVDEDSASQAGSSPPRTDRAGHGAAPPTGESAGAGRAGQPGLDGSRGVDPPSDPYATRTAGGGGAHTTPSLPDPAAAGRLRGPLADLPADDPVAARWVAFALLAAVPVGLVVMTVRRHRLRRAVVADQGAA